MSPAAEYLNAIAGWRYVIVLGTVVAGGAALAVSLMLSPKYEASATLLVAPSKFSDAPSGSMPTIDVRNYRAFLENQIVASDLVREFKLDASPYNLTPERFLRSALSVAELRESKLLKVRVRLQDPALAADVANALAARAVELARTANQEETVVARDIIKGQLDGARERLTTTRAAYEQYQREAQVELLSKDVETLVNQQSDLRKLLVSIAGERAGLARAEQELARQQRVRDVRRAIDVTAVPIREAMLDPFINPVYEFLDQQVATTRSRLALLEKERDELTRALQTKNGEVPALSEYYRRKSRLDELKMQQELAERVYMDVATRFEQARLQIAARSAQMQLVDKALPPERPVSPRTLRNVAAALVLAPALLIAGVVLLEALRRAGVLAAG